MAIFDRFRTAFTRPTPRPVHVGDVSERVSDDGPLPDSGPVAGSSADVRVAIPATPDPALSPPTADWQNEPAWLTDEDVLRDEGVIYGLSMARADEKVAMIRAWFEYQTAELSQQIEDAHVRISEYNLFIEQTENQINELRYRTEELTNQSLTEHQLPRTIVGLGLSVAMCAANFFLIDEALRPAFPANRGVAVGVWLAGLFGSFSRTSLFHENTPVSLRRLVAEAGLPMAAALFLLAQVIAHQPPNAASDSVPAFASSAGLASAFALFGFVLMLFLLGGKWLLANLTGLKNDLRASQINRRLRHDQRDKPAMWEQQRQQLEQKISALRVKKWELMPALNRAEAERNRQHARRDMLIRLFESEFHLARSLRDRLPETDRLTILN
jgi:hypothetical protein